ncbi:hypothetical protein J3459_017679 [Metarhizium acridum]|uniref:Cell wall protein n=1 Tax=Metarhizium acridum (strain CQMa 102) TaxID=655827 RepID=E9DX56_METAQ|nr:cell wall protein [Metarhizium acridum CQMa 102]EFY91614.1 cell wall protein [Metarhizium acridum CQMa 102]KAG8409138.1 hypothetical protein J3459_017679 [Metarhizium acridum]
MKLSVTVALLCLASRAYSLVAAPPPTRVDSSVPTLVDRDLATATSVLADVKNGFVALAAAAKDFNGDPGPLKTAASGLLAKVESGTTAVKNMTPLSFFECLSLLAPAQDLQKQGKALSDQLKAKKDLIQQYKQCATTYGFLDTGVTDSVALITAVVSKVPSIFKDTVQNEGNKITQQLKDLRDAFAPGNCSDS